MAVDTRNKRMGMIGLGSPVPRILPNPDGSFNLNNDRYMIMFQYPIFPEPPSTGKKKRGHSRGGLWPWERHRLLREREDEEFLLIIDG